MEEELHVIVQLCYLAYSKKIVQLCNFKLFLVWYQIDAVWFEDK